MRNEDHVFMTMVILPPHIIDDAERRRREREVRQQPQLPLPEDIPLNIPEVPVVVPN